LPSGAPGGFTALRNPARADVAVDANVTPVDERVSQQFGTTFAVRNYSIDVSGESPKSGEGVAMPAPTTLSYDPKFGSERVVEKARLVADGIVEKVKAYVTRKR
jgi:rRNA maturation protein Nop10